MEFIVRRINGLAEVGWLAVKVFRFAVIDARASYAWVCETIEWTDKYEWINKCSENEWMTTNCNPITFTVFDTRFSAKYCYQHLYDTVATDSSTVYDLHLVYYIMSELYLSLVIIMLVGASCVFSWFSFYIKSKTFKIHLEWNSKSDFLSNISPQ